MLCLRSAISSRPSRFAFKSSVICRGLKEKASKAVKPRALLVVDNMAHRVTKITQGKRGKGGGFIKATLKNLCTGFTHESTYTSDESVELAELDIRKACFSWREGADLVFLDNQTYEEIRVKGEDIEKEKFLVEGSDAKLVSFSGNVIDVELPKVAEFIVESVDSASTSLGNMPALLRGTSGCTIMVPLFIKEKDVIRVNTEEGSYVERA
tara:strand:+ start:422 stop:1051 length:630 start_codon:yes stop_codon:yes gene_type:complete